MTPVSKLGRFTHSGSCIAKGQHPPPKESVHVFPATGTNLAE